MPTPLVLPYWDWFSSNGTATAEQTAAAYYALTGRGMVSSMSYKVWNDLAARVVALVSAIGYSWNPEYKRANEVILSSGDYFTAKIANAVIQNARYPMWSWQWDITDPGYKGRQYFIGASDTGFVRTADILYGSYIIELAHVYNLLVDIYTDAGNLSRMTSSVLTAVNPSSTVFAAQSASIAVSGGGIVVPNGTLTSDPSTQLTINGLASVSHSVEMIVDIIRLFDAAGNVKVRGTVRPHSLPSASIEVVGGFSSSTSATATSCGITSLGCMSNQLAISYAVEFVAKRLAAIEAMAQELVVSQTGSAVSFPSSHASAATSLSVSNTGAAVAFPPSYCEAPAQSLSITQSGAVTASNATIVPGGSSSSRVSENGVAISREPAYVYGAGQAVMVSQNAGLEQLQPAPMRSGNMAYLAFSATLETEQPVPPSTWEYPVEEADGLRIRQVHLVYHNTSNRHVQIDLYNESSFSADSGVATNAVANGRASHNWTYPDRIPDMYGRVMNVYQSVEVTQQTDEIEVS